MDPHRTALRQQARPFAARARLQALAIAIVMAGCTPLSIAEGPTHVITVDVQQDRRPISPLIYGVNWASTAQLAELNSPFNRHGGNATSRYNWKLNASNRGRDWYYQSSGEPDASPGELVDTFIADTRAAGAEPTITMPLMDWLGKLGPDRIPLGSFSIKKYGPQTGHAPKGNPDFGNGIRVGGKYVTGNDPNDAHVRVDSAFKREWVQHLVDRWGRTGAGGVRYYTLDNEPSIWHANHRDVHPTGLTMRDLRDRIIDHARVIKEVDPNALVLAPEEWGWTAYHRSGYDQQWGALNGWGGTLPDRAANGDWPYLPWLLDQMRREHERTGKRVLDIFSVHFYPQGGESSDDLSEEKQLLRNRSTRSLWDPTYRDESWIDDNPHVIRRLRQWVNTYYPGTPIAITEYDWGAENHISGAVAQADVLGIFGREGLDIAARWEAPAPGTPVFNAIKLYRNYDGRNATFGETTVRAAVENPDVVAAFAAERSADGALTVMVLNKQLRTPATVEMDLGSFKPGGAVERWQLDAKNVITKRTDAPVSGRKVTATVPAQSVSLFVVPR
ncbi:MAG: glycoside hydrolase family 44 protein [Burkholderiales bacterium]